MSKTNKIVMAKEKEDNVDKIGSYYYVVEVPQNDFLNEENEKNEEVGQHESKSKNREEIDAIAIHQFGCDGVEDFSLDEAAIDDILGEKSYVGVDIPEESVELLQLNREKDSEQKIKYYFYDSGETGDTEEGVEALASEVRAKNFVEFLQAEFPAAKITLEERKNQDWNAMWMDFYQPIVIKNALKIVPSWMKEEHLSMADNLLPIYIYPGQGFGTGGHETTFLCLELLAEIWEGGKNPAEALNVLDFGCGSGILGIAAKKMGAGEVVLVDKDPSALVNTRQNIELNEFQEREFALSCRGEVFEDSSHEKGVEPQKKGVEKYDLIFANILLNIVIAKKEDLALALKTGGKLIVSGILKEQSEELMSEVLGVDCGAGKKMILEKVVQKGHWMAYLFAESKSF